MPNRHLKLYPWNRVEVECVEHPNKCRTNTVFYSAAWPQEVSWENVVFAVLGFWPREMLDSGIPYRSFWQFNPLERGLVAFSIAPTSILPRYSLTNRCLLQTSTHLDQRLCPQSMSLGAFKRNDAILRPFIFSRTEKPTDRDARMNHEPISVLNAHASWIFWAVSLCKI